MTKKPKYGTLSTRRYADKKKVHKESNVPLKMKRLLGKNMVRFHSHANHRMEERNIIDYEVRQALANGRYNPARDRFSHVYNLWQYSFEGLTMDQRFLRIGLCFELVEKNR